MKFIVDGIAFENVFVKSLNRSIKVESGSNSGTFITGDRFYDTRKSYYQYSMVINPSTMSFGEYEQLYALLGLPMESHEITLPYGQKMITFNAHVSSISDNCKKIYADRTLWGDLSVTFEGTEAVEL